MKGTFERHKDALHEAQEAERKAKRRAAVKKGTLPPYTTWGDWWDLLVEKRRFDSDTGYTESCIVEGYLRPKWGDVPVNEITNGEIKDWLDDLVAGRLARSDRVKGPPSPGYVHRIYSVFNVSIKALLPEVLDASPCAGIKLPKRPKRSKPYMSVQHANAIKPKLRADYQDAVDFALETGLRPGELVGLHACRIDRETRRLEVCETFVRRKKVIKGHPKDRDARHVPLTDKAIEILDRRLGKRDRTQGCGLAHADGTNCCSPLVFLTLRGRVMNPDTLGWHLRESARKAGVPTKSAYSMRRGFATRAAEGGVDAFDLARVMGHADINETNDYVQATTRVGDRLRAALGERPPLQVIDGERGTERGTGPDSQPLPSATAESEEDAS